MICPKCGRAMWPTIWDPWFNPGTLYQVTYRCRCGQERTQAVRMRPAYPGYVKTSFYQEEEGEP